MHRGFNVVVCVPAGRQRTMSLLLKHLKSQQGLVDGVQLWRNTKNQLDLQFIDEQDGFNEFIKVVPLDSYEKFRSPLQTNTGRFYLNTMVEDTIYIRFDDDVVYIHPDAIRNLVDARIDNPNALALCATTWNNAVVSHYLQKNKKIATKFGDVKNYCMDDIGWANGKFAKYMHELLLTHINNGSVDQLYMPNVTLPHRHRFSVSAICWFGKYWKSWDHIPVPKRKRQYDMFPAHQLWLHEEEQWITDDLPHQAEMSNLLVGNAIVAHYTFFPQKDFIDNKTNILEQYADIADRLYHDKYYDILGLMERGWKTYRHTPWFQEHWAKNPRKARNWKLS